MLLRIGERDTAFGATAAGGNQPGSKEMLVLNLESVHPFKLPGGRE